MSLVTDFGIGERDDILTVLLCFERVIRAGYGCFG